MRTTAVTGAAAITAVRATTVSVTMAYMIMRMMMPIIRVRRATISVMRAGASTSRAALVAKGHENKDNEKSQAEKKFHGGNPTIEYSDGQDCPVMHPTGILVVDSQANELEEVWTSAVR